MKKRMFRSLIHLTLAVCLLTALLCGCRGVESCPAAPEQTADTSLFLTEPGSWDGDVPQDIIELIDTAGHRVTRTATAPGILHGQRYHMELDDDKLHAVSVYKYENAADAAAEAACKKLGVHAVTGRIATGDWFATRSPRSEEMVARFAPTVCEMEACAIAQVCLRNNVKFMAIKSVSDRLTSEKQADEFFDYGEAIKKLDGIMLRFTEKLMEVMA